MQTKCAESSELLKLGCSTGRSEVSEGPEHTDVTSDSTLFPCQISVSKGKGQPAEKKVLHMAAVLPGFGGHFHKFQQT